MKSSVFLAASGALLALASPVDLKKKRDLEVVYDTVYTTVYVTDPPPTATMFAAGAHSIPTISSSSPPPPPPPSTTSTTPSPTPVADTPAPAAPEPSTPAAAQVQAETSTPAAQAATPTDYASTGVYHHNLHRSNHSAPALAWDDTYAGYAQTVAESCVFAHNLGPGGGGYGQNLAMWASSSDPESLGASAALAQAITDMWYDGEINSWPAADYGQATPDMSNFESWGHFSQVVWAGSTSAGCYSQYCAPGTMYADMGAWYTVCNYYPAGNVGGEYGSNVLPPLGEASVSV